MVDQDDEPAAGLQMGDQDDDPAAGLQMGDHAAQLQSAAGLQIAFARPVQPPEMEYSLLKRRFNVFQGLVASFALITPMRWTYRSLFLEMAECPQTLENRNSSAETTFSVLKVFRKIPHLNIGIPSTETAQIGYWLLQHSALILYEFDDAERKHCALQSFPKDLVGSWCYPDGDLVVIPRESADKPLELFIALRDIQKAIDHLINTRGPCNQKLVTTDRDDDSFKHLKITKGNIATCKSIQVPLLFKPIFFPKYFKYEDSSVMHPKKVLILDLLQKAGLVLFHISDLATASKRPGSSLLFAQGMSAVTQLMDLLLQTTILTDKLAYTHFLTRYCLANCLFQLILTFEGYGDEYTSFYKTRVDMAAFFSVIREFEERHRKEIQAAKYKEVLTVSTEPSLSAKAAVKIFKSLNLPSNWRRSSFRKNLATLLEEYYNINGVVDKEIDRRSFNLKIEQIRQIQGRLSSIHSELVESLESTEFHYLLVISRLLTAKCLKILASMQASKGMDSLFCAVVARSEEGRREIRVVVETFGTEGPLTKAEFDLYIKMEEQQISAMNIFKGLSGSQKKSARKSFIACQKEFFFDQIFFQIELEDRKLQDCTPPCTVSNLLMAFSIAMAPFEDGTSDDASEVTAFNQMAGAFCFGLSHLYLIKHYREHKSFRERKEMWLSNSIYYHQLTAMYLRQPGVGITLLQMVVNNAERAKGSYTAGMSVSKQQPIRALAVLRRMMLMLPLVWELCIMEGMDSPTNYGRVFKKDLALPCRLRDLEKAFSTPTFNVFRQINDGLQLIPTKYLKPYKIEMTGNSTICSAVDAIKIDLQVAFVQHSLLANKRRSWKEYCFNTAKKITLSLMKVAEGQVYGTQSSTISIDAVATEAATIASFLMKQIYTKNIECWLPRDWVLSLFSLCFSILFAISACNYLGEGAANLHSRTQICLYACNPTKSPSVKECISSLLTEENNFPFTMPEDYQAHLFKAVCGLMDNLNIVMLNGDGDLNSFVPRNVARLLELLHVGKFYSNDATIETIATALVHSVVTKFPDKSDGDTVHFKERQEQTFSFPGRHMATAVAVELSKNLNSAFAAKLGWKVEASLTSTKLQYDPLTVPGNNSPTDQAEKEYDPYSNVDDFIKEEEKTCPGFGDEQIDATFERVLGDFYGQPNCAKYMELIEKLSTSLGSTMQNLHKYLFKIEQKLASSFPSALRMISFDKSGLDEIEMSDEFFQELRNLCDLIQPDRRSLFSIARALYGADKLLFKGHTVAILRGTLPGVS